MNETKFIVWDKKSKKMRKLDSIAFDNKGNIKLVNTWGYDIIEDKPIILKRESHYKLLQYTGLKDRNGEEIYEGYIVKVFVSTDPEMPEYISPVYDYYGAFAVKCKGLDIYTDHFVLGWLEDYDIEVIGNTYENPELLENTNE